MIPWLYKSNFPVEEYLVSGRLASANDDISRFRVSKMPAHIVVA
jgi:hypothetical protein